MHIYIYIYKKVTKKQTVRRTFSGRRRRPFTSVTDKSPITPGRRNKTVYFIVAGRKKNRRYVGLKYYYAV